MALPQQTFSRTNLREFAFVRDNFLRRVEHVFSHSPTAAIFLDETLGDFGTVSMRGAGHRVEEGGHAIVIPVTLGTHSGAGTMPSPWGKHNVAADDNVRLAEANWHFYQHGLAIAEHEIAINRGEFARASFVEHQTEQVLTSLVDLATRDLFSTAAGAETFASFDTLINANQASVQGLPSTTLTAYNSRGLSNRGTAPAAVTFTSGPFSTQGIEDMRTAYNNCSEGMLQPNVIITEYATHERYEGRMQPAERFIPMSTGDAGFKGLAFRATPVLADPNATAGMMFFLNVGDRGIQFVALRDFDFDFGPFKPASEQNVAVSPLRLTGQLVIQDRRLSNKMTAIVD